MKIYSFFLFFLFANLAFTQTVRVDLNGYRDKNDTSRIVVTYTNLAEANKVNPDSVKGLILKSNGFKDFPKEILIFKNLRYLDFKAYYWEDVLDSLTIGERREYDSLKKHFPNKYTFTGEVIFKYYKRNEIKRIPKGIKKLTKLEFVSFRGAYIRNYRRFKKIYKYLPNVYIDPLKNDL